MIAQTVLHQYLGTSAMRRPEHTAIEDPATDGSITYAELDALSNRLRDRLWRWGVRPGDRVGIYLRKSIDSVASVFGILKTGAAYVPVDPGASVSRNAYILNNCSVKVTLVEDRFANGLAKELAQLGDVPRLLVLDWSAGDRPLASALQREDDPDPAPPSETVIPSPDDLGYILYTSGSTGKPKGVMLSHRNGVSYVDWCSEVFQPRESDRFSSHAPFHFDLSILDIYLPIKHSATLVLIGEEIGKQPQQLAALIAERRISLWYSAPSILSVLAEYGDLAKHDYSALRIVNFAGEVFPVKHLRRLKSLWPHPRYFNLYGPTETNVCTFFEIPPAIPDERTEPYPIGQTCAHLQSVVVDEQGQMVTAGLEGELCISGPGVMQGYWSLPERTATAFLAYGGRNWYKTGDIVVEGADGNFIFVGRRDRMVKKRGYRIELGEIESGLYKHPAIKEAAVIAIQNEGGVRIKAFLSCKEGRPPSIIELKRFCAENLPIYMVPDVFSFQDWLPKTSTDKINYQRLKEME
ncbi:MAG: amino acid adenylation domain-containing protein [Chloroflexi bacterium]|nr:amino acid adenylation domain-containing protein [Chloroflexota bacterium]